MAEMKQFLDNSYLFGGNAPFIEDLYEKYLVNPQSVPEEWREYFDRMQVLPGRPSIVLDVAQIRRWATAYGPHVTYVAVDGARHDVVLSREEPRQAAYDAINTWMGAWVDPPSRSLL